MFAAIEIINNETTALSTHVRPTKDQLERADITLWDALLPRVAAQHTPAAVEPVGDRRSVWRVLTEIGRRLGHQFADTTSAEITDDTTMLAGMPPVLAVCSRTRRRALGRGPPRGARAVGRRTCRTDGRLAARAPAARRPAGRPQAHRVVPGADPICGDIVPGVTVAPAT
ncbi:MULTISPECIES: hypothetical protein [unclassified Pseudofrankia]|uniref:hypothetical protein n=1 Tax=unclassified Pseudofrankia TaxID=2994372 RepID=UPI0008DA79DF|nr:MULTISPECIES: hypothetical protein [unclassified Pseudofrankia]MDT3445647.1 hypothetical protein [Pseudofrankia sp. BMG5.37]OHV53838.1 hypothetical protein BCD48_44640 [Pseudofrankia sp. BMG5.36]